MTPARDPATVRYAGVFIGLLIVLLYARAIPGDFIYDDLYYVRDNPAIRRLANLPFFFSNPETAVAHPEQARMIYRPLATSAYAAQHAIFNANPSGYHVFSLLVFLNVVGVIHSLVAYLRGGDNRAAALAASLVAIHPMSAEAAAWVSAQATLWCAVWLLSSVLVFQFGMRCVDRRRDGYMFAAALFALIAMLFKETGVVAPFVLMVSAATADPSIDRRGAKPVIALTFVFAAIYFIVRTMLVGRVAQIDAGGNLGEHLLRVLAAPGVYVTRFLFPINARIFFPEAPIDAPHILIGIAFFVGLPFAAWRLRQKHPVASLGLAIAWLTYLPSSNIVPIGMPIAERYFLLPLCGFAIALGDLSRSLLGGRAGNVAVPTLMLIACVLALTTFERARIWSRPEIFWNQAIVDRPDRALGYYNLGLVAAHDGDLPAAETHYRRALEIEPRHAPAMNNLGTTLARQNKFDEAASVLSGALALRPGDVKTLDNLVKVRLQQGRPHDAALVVAGAIERSATPAIANYARSLLGAGVLAESGEAAIREAFARL
ncbi:tetratricopeptide repeat protein [bacterium]|nr:tetratricopeptide repeat protein [bacterium]